jgi:hypothetical protein
MTREVTTEAENSIIRTQHAVSSFVGTCRDLAIYTTIPLAGLSTTINLSRSTVPVDHHPFSLKIQSQEQSYNNTVRAGSEPALVTL